MREIKFRAMNYVSHTWWYGSNQVDRIDYGTNTMPIRTFWRWFAENALDPKTLGQYTGLKAKEVEVYEGDITRETDLICDDIVSVVKWGTIDYDQGWCDTPEMTGWLLKAKGYDPMPLFVFSITEVIGSIHSNPGLLKEDLNEGRRQTKQRTSTARGG